MALNVIKGSMIKGFTPPPPPELYSNGNEALTLLKITDTMEALLRTLYNLKPIEKASLLSVLFVCIILIVRQANAIRYPPNLPRVREPPGSSRFSIKTTWAYYTDCRQLWNEAYHTVSRCSFSYFSLLYKLVSNEDFSMPRTAKHVLFLELA